MWTPTPPATDGRFWCQQPGEEPEVVRIGHGYARCGDDAIPLGDTGEWRWWSEPLVPPAG